jgi:hypothetical protein
MNQVVPGLEKCILKAQEQFQGLRREGFDFYQPIVAAAILTTATTAVCVYHFLLHNWRQYAYIPLERQGIPQEISWGRSKVLSGLESIPE